MNTKKANTEPFRVYHDFHEKINTTIKVLSASVFNLTNHLNQTDDEKELGRIIVKTDKSWPLPPVWSLNKNLSKDMFNDFWN